MQPAIAIAGIRGGSGKTITSIGLCRAFRRRGIEVAPFKKGPDYIDPAWLSLSAGNECHNLDSFLFDGRIITQAFYRYGTSSGISLVEGNRGLFDGYDELGTHSFAELVKHLGIPLILVVDCTKSSRTTAAVVLGCCMFDRDLPIKGVILNRIAGERHRRIVTQSIEKYCGVPVLGAIPRILHLDLPERQLGLLPMHEYGDPEALVDSLGQVMLDSVDIDAILDIARAPRQEREMPAESGIYPARPAVAVSTQTRLPRIGILHDSAFNFYYPENIERLQAAPAEIVRVDSMRQAEFPDVDGLYIGGGFPETHAKAISANTRFTQGLRARIDQGMPVYAECGGLIYLSDSMIVDGTRYPMAGVFPFIFDIARTPEAHGYTVFEVDTANPFFETGGIIRGHEFRYARLLNPDVMECVATVMKMKRGKGIARGRDGALYKNTLAAFTHTHALSAGVDWFEAMVRSIVSPGRI